MLVALLLVLAQTDAPVATVVVSQRPGAEPHAGKIATRVHQALVRAGLPEALEPTAALKQLRAAGVAPLTCEGARPCVAKLASALGPRAIIIGVDVGKVVNLLAVHLEAIEAGNDAPVAVADVSVTVNQWGPEADAALAKLVDAVKAHHTPEPPPPPPRPVDAPVAAKLTPSRVEAPPDAVTTSVPAPRTAAWVTAGGAVATAALATTFTVLGLQDKARYDAALVEGGRGTTLTAAEAEALAQSANGRLTVGLVSALVTAGLTGLSTYLFVR